MKIAVDFDGTIVEHKYPKIGKEIPFAITTLKKLQADKHKIILWTVREGALLNDAINFCKEKGLDFYAINNDQPEEYLVDEPESFKTRKLNVDLFIDDRNVGGLPDWGIIYEMITNKYSFFEYLNKINNSAEMPKKSLIKRIFGNK